MPRFPMAGTLQSGRSVKEKALTLAGEFLNFVPLEKTHAPMKPNLALLLRLLWAAALVLPAINAQAEVVFTSLYSFTNGNDGAGLYAGLVQGADGYFYGTTQDGGANSRGTVFRISTNGALTNLYSLGGGNGGDPDAGLIQGNDDSFYGTTYGGGTNGYGTVFRLTIVPEFQAVTLTNNILNLTWSTEAGGSYQLQYTSNLGSGIWSNLSSSFIATGASASTTDFLTNSTQRFYRLMLLP
jgi:uncharacterized repeat protein (TIGR03803 family)